MLKLSITEAEYKYVVLKASEYQKEIIQGLAERAESVKILTKLPFFMYR